MDQDSLGSMFYIAATYVAIGTAVLPYIKFKHDQAFAKLHGYDSVKEYREMVKREEKISTAMKAGKTTAYSNFRFPSNHIRPENANPSPDQ